MEIVLIILLCLFAIFGTMWLHLKWKIHRIEKKENLMQKENKKEEHQEKPNQTISEPVKIPKVKRPNNRPVMKLLNRSGQPFIDEQYICIAGLKYHTSPSDMGWFSGWIDADVGNPVDSRARGVFNSKGKLLGFVPAKELDDYIAWSGGKPMPCVGFIFEEEGQIRGRAKVVKPCNPAFLQDQFSRFSQWVVDNYGIEYAPKSIEIEFDVDDDDVATKEELRKYHSESAAKVLHSQEAKKNEDSSGCVTLVFITIVAAVVYYLCKQFL